LANLVGRECAIKSLSLNWNSIQSEGAEALSIALKTNSVLTDLGLGWNCIGNGGALAIGQALPSNTTLTKLNLSQNRLGGLAIVILSEGMRLSTSLTAVDMCHNPLGKPGLDLIARTLELNKNIQIGGLETCDKVFAMGNGLDPTQTPFNVESPSGRYKLNLGKPWDYAVAELLRSRAIASGDSHRAVHVSIVSD
jgi:hypothetical protein